MSGSAQAASLRAHVKGVARARWASGSQRSRRTLVPCDSERAQRNEQRRRGESESAATAPTQMVTV
eukprot:3883389-Pleurochrysis_carterae.AAC.1